MARSVHPSAVVEEGATLGEDVQVGPFCHVGRQVRLGDGCVLHAHVVVAGRTDVGPGSQIFPFASVGHPPQDLKYAGEPSTLEIGAGNIVREHVTMNRVRRAAACAPSSETEPVHDGRACGA